MIAGAVVPPVAAGSAEAGCEATDGVVDLWGFSDGSGYMSITGDGQVVFYFTGAAYAEVLPLTDIIQQGGTEPLVAVMVDEATSHSFFVTKHGRVISTGPWFGDLRGVALNAPIIDAVLTPSGQGYYLLAEDGGIFAYGDAVFAGSMGGIPLNEPTNGLVPDPDGKGYWMVASDGGVFAFSSRFVGSIPGVLEPGQQLNQPVVGMVSSGTGYLMVASDGGVFAFGGVNFHGSLGGATLGYPITSITAVGDGYAMVDLYGQIHSFGQAPQASQLLANACFDEMSVPTPRGGLSGQARQGLQQLLAP